MIRYPRTWILTIFIFLFLFISFFGINQTNSITILFWSRHDDSFHFYPTFRLVIHRSKYGRYQAVLGNLTCPLAKKKLSSAKDWLVVAHWLLQLHARFTQVGIWNFGIFLGSSEHSQELRFWKSGYWIHGNSQKWMNLCAAKSREQHSGENSEVSTLDSELYTEIRKSTVDNDWQPSGRCRGPWDLEGTKLGFLGYLGILIRCLTLSHATVEGIHNWHFFNSQKSPPTPWACQRLRTLAFSGASLVHRDCSTVRMVSTLASWQVPM